MHSYGMRDRCEDGMVHLEVSLPAHSGVTLKEGGR